MAEQTGLQKITATLTYQFYLAVKVADIFNINGLSARCQRR